MRNMLNFLFLAGALGLGCASGSSAGGGAAAGAAALTAVGRVRHVVLFKFKDGTAPEKIREIEAAFAALPGKVPQIKAYEWGTDMSPEGLQAGHTHCFLVTFATPADRDAYLPHPAHTAFVDILKPHLDKATVVDYIAKDGP